ncbi:MAG: histidine kinase [Bacteroidales bacterium]|nr:histidine kinase [Bacteroidales bacterium]
MLNPLSQNRSYIATYIMVWAAIIALHTLIINLFYGINSLTSLGDSLVFNVIFMIIGFSLWYVIRFNLKEKPSVIDIIFNHLLVALVIIVLWLGIGYFILVNLFPNNSDYITFLRHSLAWRSVTGIFYYLLFVMFYYLILYYDDLQEKLKTESELQKLVTKAELDALKSQINPHFLFNSLNSISSLTITRPEKAQDMVIKLSDFLRYSLSHSKNEQASLKEEFENLRRYLEIEKIRFGNRLKFIFDVPDKCYDSKIPNMILQPLIENSIKHGVYKSSEETEVDIRCREENDYIAIEITNDYDPDTKKPVGEGVGLQNIRKRLLLIYGRNDLLETVAEKMIFKAILKLPKN